MIIFKLEFKQHRIFDYECKLKNLTMVNPNLGTGFESLFGVIIINFIDSGFVNLVGGEVNPRLGLLRNMNLFESKLNIFGDSYYPSAESCDGGGATILNAFFAEIIRLTSTDY